MRNRVIGCDWKFRRCQFIFFFVNFALKQLMPDGREDCPNPQRGRLTEPAASVRLVIV